jgi:ATP-binding cassette subfamily A (ABC1) protein 3
MITGLVEPSDGNIFINDYDIVKNNQEARDCIGLCPQHNLLFDDLTVFEHLKFFSKLKENFDEKEIDNMLEIINLADKKHALSKTLSGGMKRKLSIAIAFIGNSSIVVLDEPSNFIKYLNFTQEKNLNKLVQMRKEAFAKGIDF